MFVFNFHFSKLNQKISNFFGHRPSCLSFAQKFVVISFCDHTLITESTDLQGVAYQDAEEKTYFETYEKTYPAVASKAAS